MIQGKVKQNCSIVHCNLSIQISLRRRVKYFL